MEGTPGGLLDFYDYLTKGGKGQEPGFGGVLMKKFGSWALLLVLFLMGMCLGLYRRGFLTPIELDSPDDLKVLFESVVHLEPPAVIRLREREYADQEEGRWEYYYQQLEEEEKKAYRQMLESFRGWEDEFFLTISDEDSIDRVYHAVLNDHPEIFWVRNRQPVFKTLYGGQSYSSFTPAYSYGDDSDTPWESEEVWQISQAMEDAVLEIEDSLWEGATDYDKASAAYIWLIDHTEYLESEHDQSVAGVFWKQQAVCAGYAAAFQYLCERLGVFCIYVEGESTVSEEGHAWNIIRLEDEYYYVDATNGDQPEFLTGDAASLEEHKTILMDYLCPFPQEYEQLYETSDMFPVPSCDSTAMNFYVLNNGCMFYYDEQEIDDYFHMRIDNGAAVIRFKFASQEAYEEAVEEWGYSAGLEDAIQYYMRCNDLLSVSYHYGLLRSLLTMYYIF